MSIAARRLRPVLAGLLLGACGLTACHEHEALPAGSLLRLFPDRERSDAKLGGANRQTFALAPGERARQRIVVPPRARLELSYGLQKRAWQKLRHPLTLRALARAGEGDEEVLYEGTLRPHGRGTGFWWQEVRAELDRFAGREVELELAVSAAPSGGRQADRGAEPTYLWIGSPVLYTPLAASLGPDVILIGIDTLRSDRLGAYGAEPSPSPFLDELARRGTVFESAWSQANYTLPGFASIFTGLYPSHHEAVEGRRLPPGILTIPRLFAAHGYYTVGFHAGGFMGSGFGWGASFDRYDAFGGMKGIDHIASWLEEHRGLPHFLFVHTYDVHSPYGSAPETYREDLPRGGYEDVWRLAQRKPQAVADEAGRNPFGPEDYAFMRDLYDAEIRFVDDQIRALVERLGGWSLLEDTLLVVVSDHGEEFGEHGGLEHHGAHLNREQLQVPLILAGPGVPAGRRVSRPVQTMDLLPSLAELTGLRSAELDDLDGRSFVAALTGRASSEGEREAAIAELPTSGRYSVRAGGWALLAGPEGAQLFDTRSDPEESNDLAASRPDVVIRLRRLYEERAKPSGTPPPPDEEALPEDTLRELRALGYVD